MESSAGRPKTVFAAPSVAPLTGIEKNIKESKASITDCINFIELYFREGKIGPSGPRKCPFGILLPQIYKKNTAWANSAYTVNRQLFEFAYAAFFL